MIRALGRHLRRIIYNMLKEEREYELRSTKGIKTRVTSRSSLKTQIPRPKISVKEKKKKIYKQITYTAFIRLKIPAR
jgi:hypothetical protein